MKKLIVSLIFALMLAMPVCAFGETIVRYNTVSLQELYDHFYNTDTPAIAPFAVKAAPESCLYYDQLTDIEKQIYDAFESQIMNTTDGKSDISYSFNIKIEAGLTSISGDNIFNAIQEQYGIDSSTFMFRAPFAFMQLDHPQYCWIDSARFYTKLSAGSYNYNTGEIKLYLNFGKNDNNEDTTYFLNIYHSEAEVLSDYNNMMAKAREIVNSAPKGSSDWGKLNHYMNWLRDNCQYNTYLSSKGESKYAYIAPSALLHGKDGKNAPVCEGYSEAFKILCDLSGIDAMCVEATAGNAAHKWNLVRLNDKFYHCDPTWFDSTITSISAYRFLLTGSVNMAQYDDKDGNHVISYQKPFAAPAISSTDYLNDVGINGYSVLNINGDSKIDKNDSVLLLRIISGISKGTAKDVNGDSKTNINDVVKMQKLMFK